ncbi:MAG: hypothetical protein R3B54_14145 [Bdellovibrionota bacterium]
MSRTHGLIALCLYALSLSFASFPKEFLPTRWTGFHSNLRRFHRNLLMEPGMGVFKGEGGDEMEHLSCFQVVGFSANESATLYETHPHCEPPPFLTADLLGITLYRALATEPLVYPDKERAALRAKHFQAASRFFCRSSLYEVFPRQKISILWKHQMRSYQSGHIRDTDEAPYAYDCEKDTPLETSVSIAWRLP